MIKSILGPKKKKEESKKEEESKTGKKKQTPGELRLRKGEHHPVLETAALWRRWENNISLVLSSSWSCEQMKPVRTEIFELSKERNISEEFEYSFEIRISQPTGICRVRLPFEE
mmetsp:Transcript_17867/g.20277  ORF Transcript_17867/g.20277 Transcript_17867/m.20277 type:complete len:114 (-) Transcript_17867:84-425(-)